MNERPILFSGPMVRAILDGRKTMTRRVIKTDGYGAEAVIKNDNAPLHVRIVDDLGASVPFSCPYGQPGDRLWVRETWAALEKSHMNVVGLKRLYKADAVPDDSGERVGWWVDTDRKGNEEFVPGKILWKPSIFMPRWASRLTLEITAIRVERLQDISEEDAKAEGAERLGNYGDEWTAIPEGTFRIGYRALWDSLNAKRGYGWDMNPWVWVITFRGAA